MPLMRRNSDVYQRRIDDKEAGKAVYVVAVYDYGPKVETFCNDGTDLAMAIGDLVEVTDAKLAETGGWWAGINVRTKDTGIFPKSIRHYTGTRDQGGRYSIVQFRYVEDAANFIAWEQSRD